MALVLAACGGSGDDDNDDGSSADGGDSPTSLVLAGGTGATTYDYTESQYGGIPIVLMHNVIEPLLEKMGDGSLEPLLAESFDVSDDGREYTFTLREATFHDGSDLTADDLVYSLELYQEALNPVVSDPLQGVEEITKTDDRTVQVTLEEPSQQFLESMSRHSGLVIPEGSKDQLDQSPVGTGPYTFDEWRTGVDISLKRYEDYWAELPYFEHVTWRLIEDQTARVNSFLAGEIDIGPDPQMIEDVAGEVPSDVEVVEQVGQHIYFLFLNSENEKFADERVRAAIGHAIDREELIAGEGTSSLLPTCLYVNPPTEPWNSDYCPYPYDPDRARELLADAGVEDLSIEFTFVTGLGDNVASITASQLSDVGISLERKPQEAASFLEDTLETHNYEFGYVSTSQQMDSFMCPARFTQDCVPEFDDLLSEADRALDRDEWADLRRQAAELLSERGYIIPVFNGQDVYSVREGLTGIKPYTAYAFDLRDVRREE